MNKGKHSNNKVIKRKKNKVNEMEEIYSNSRPVRKKRRKPQSKGWRIFDNVLKIFLGFECAILLGVITFIGLLEWLTPKYIIITTSIFAFICGLQTFLRFFKKKRPLLRTISLILTVVTMYVTYSGTFMLATVYAGIKDMTSGEYEVDPKYADVTKEPFLIYVSGSDARDVSEIQEKGLSDLNMIIAVNPKKREILMVNTPRDYFLPLYGGEVAKNGHEGKKDKLTHAGAYGIDCSMKTLEKFYAIEFNYYVKINFKSVVELVDAVGGVTVNSEYEFTSRYGMNKSKTYSFKKGKNKLDGDAALAFARERKTLPGGDRQRGKHQQLVISAVVDKAVSPAILNLSNFKNLLTAVTSNTKMNISAEELKALFQMQLDDMVKWDVESISVDGRGSSNGYGYTYPNQALWVMDPYTDNVVHETVTEARKALAEFMN